MEGWAGSTPPPCAGGVPEGLHSTLGVRHHLQKGPSVGLQKGKDADGGTKTKTQRSSSDFLDLHSFLTAFCL